MAKVMIFGQQYAEAAAGIARTIDEFDTMQARRFAQDVEHASAASQKAYRMAVSAIAALLLCSALALWGLYKRSEEHTSELQSLMRISYAVFCLKKKKTKKNNIQTRMTNKKKN